MTGKRVLIVGESWVVHSIHQKGFDSFTTTEYAEGVSWLRDALESGGFDVEYQPAHVAARDFPQTAEGFARYDAVVISDVGANTLLLHPDTFSKSVSMPNRLAALRDYVAAGGAMVMIGGYMTFQGIDGKARYRDSPIAAALPVELLPHDDRVEVPEGVVPTVALPDHSIAAGIDGAWPAILGYNRFTARVDSGVVVTVGDDPLIVTGTFGAGRTVAFASDCGPHWAPPSFVEWSGYRQMWTQLLAWATDRDATPPS